VTQNVEPYSSPEARAFDFWIGNWAIQQRILQQDGTWFRAEATTSVSPTLNGSALLEHWVGTVQFFWEGMNTPQMMQGLSIRAYDPQTGKWYIHWMDTRAPYFGDPYIGNFDQNQGEFYREWRTPQGKRLGRITFSEITLDSVVWDLAMSTDEGQTWTTLWIMEMSRISE
jgi:hypothetical protein